MINSVHTLPGGYWDKQGQLHREVVIMPLSGHEEELLAQSAPFAMATVITTVLTRCVLRIGTLAMTTEIARQLLIGDRQYLLLLLRALTFGDQVQANRRCPWPDCGQTLDIDFKLSNFPVQTIATANQPYTVILSPAAVENQAWAKRQPQIQFRLPNGEDQEIVAPLLEQNEAQALTQLLCRCIYSLGEIDKPSPELISELSPLARQEIEVQMEALMPGVDLTLTANCPHCEREFTVPFELADFFFGELATGEDLLRREVHYLAYHYHWNESEILALPRYKRRAYIEILASEIERLNDAFN
jgi:hypothetical protein